VDFKRTHDWKRRLEPATTVHIDILLNPMNVRPLTIALVLVVCIADAARDQSFPSPASALMMRSRQNELTDRAQQRKRTYPIDKREGKQTLTEEQVETKGGPPRPLVTEVTLC
jgi:hypothetical protein